MIQWRKIAGWEGWFTPAQVASLLNIESRIEVKLVNARDLALYI